MSKKVVQLNEEVIKSEIKELVRGSVEETLGIIGIVTTLFECVIILKIKARG